MNSGGTSFAELFDQIMRKQCEALLNQTLECEVEEWLEQFENLKDENGRSRLVRNGYLPTRSVFTVAGAVSVYVPRTRDRCNPGKDCGTVFRSAILRTYQRHLNCCRDHLNWHFLRAVVSGDPSDVLLRLLGRNYFGTTDGLLKRLRATWRNYVSKLLSANLSGHNYIEIKHGIVFGATAGDEDRSCFGIVIGITEFRR